LNGIFLHKGFLFAVLFSQMVHAAPGWWARTCSRLIETRAATPTPELLHVENELRNEIHRNSKFSAHAVAMSHGPLEFLAQKPLGIEIVPTLSSDYRRVRDVDLRIFVNPSAIDLKWDDEVNALADGPALMLLFEDLPVRTNRGHETTVQALFEQEFAAVVAKNPEIQAQMKTVAAGNFSALSFRREYRDFKVTWVEGKIPNFQVKRILLLALDNAFSQIAGDSRYAMKKDPAPPTEH
jgi:hypothetical protein